MTWRKGLGRRQRSSQAAWGIATWRGVLSGTASRKRFKDRRRGNYQGLQGKVQGDLKKRIEKASRKRFRKGASQVTNERNERKDWTAD